MVVHESKQLAQSQLTELATVARSVQDKVDRCLFERYGDVQAFGLNRTFHRDLAKLSETDRSNLTGLLNDYAKSYGCYDLCLVLDPAGNVLLVNAVSPTGEPLPNAHLLVGQNLAENEGYRLAGGVDGHGGFGAGEEWLDRQSLWRQGPGLDHDVHGTDSRQSDR